VYYLYVKTHRKTGLKYLGQTKRNPYDYKGSGTYWVNHIKKHGNDVDTEVLMVFIDKDALRHWGIYFSDKWNVVLSEEWANLKREEGDGGFEHINNIQKDKRVNVISLKQKIANGQIKCGGTENWDEESWKKVRAMSFGSEERKDFDPNNWSKMSDEQYEVSRKKLSDSASGEKNSAYGTHIYIKEDFDGNLPPTTQLNKNRYREGEQPKGWITVTEWRDNRKDKTNSAYGRHWYNDGKKNYYLYDSDILIKELNLEKKRLPWC
jgi:hypothetical protein